MHIDYLTFGEKGLPMVFLHGWQQDMRTFLPLVPLLYKKYRLFLIDLPGFGKSDLPPADYTSFDYAQSIIGWLRENRLTNVILVGHSFGGKVATIVANHQPKMISRLVLVATAGLPHPKVWYPLIKIFPSSIKKILSPITRKILASRDYRGAGKLQPIFKSTVKESLEPVFKSLQTPTLIIWGKQDDELPFSDGQKISQLIKGSQLKIIPGHHQLFLEKPTEIANLINQFCSK